MCKGVAAESGLRQGLFWFILLQVRDFFQRVQLSPIDTYFMIDCVNGGKVPEPVDPSRMDPSRRV